MARFIISVLKGMMIGLLIPVIGLALLLFVVAETLSGRLFAMAILLFATTVFLLLRIKTRRIGPWIPASALIGAVLYGVCYQITPNGKTPNDSSIQSIFLNGPAYKRTSIANLVPEIDQIKLGTYLVSTLDPFVDNNKATRIRNLFMDTYIPMQESRDYKSTGSVLNYAYRDLFLKKRPCQHFYLYVPAAAKGKRVPLIVFLHGSGGNLKMYMWKWRAFAEKYNVVVAAPSFGFGFWDREGAPELLDNVLKYCRNTDSFSISKQYLIGLSNGGIGVYRLGNLEKYDFSGLALISPVMESKYSNEQYMKKQMDSRAVLVIHGTEDKRIPLNYVREKTAILHQRGVKPQLEEIDKEDHFLFLSSWEKVSEILSSWMKL
ncbi:MAG: hypothetical protein JXR40_11725 [Pontiellaceae bacterium]|nr:hypothetical protein [Pontiellaceae bacterium]